MSNSGFTTQVAESIPFSDPALVATNVQSAILEVNAAIGSAGLPPDYITTTFDVPANHQLVIFQRFTVGSGGHLTVEGRIRIL